MTTTTGKSMLGNWSTCSRWYENSPSTTRASMTMVAKTGFFRLTRVNHMACAVPRQGAVRGVAGAVAPPAEASCTAVPSRIGPMVPESTLAPSSRPLTVT